MAQEFDTGLSAPQRTLLRAAVIEKLSPLLKTSGLYAVAIKALPRPYKGAGDEEGLAFIERALQGQAPAILVALGKATFRDGGMPMTLKRGELELAIYVTSLHSRDVTSGRLAGDVVAAADNSKDPGIETMLEHVQQLLQGQDLGVDSIYEPDIQGEDEVHTGLDFTIWEQTYRVQVDREIDPARALAIVTSFDTAHALADAVPAPNPANPIIDHITPLEAP